MLVVLRKNPLKLQFYDSLYDNTGKEELEIIRRFLIDYATLKNYPNVTNLKEVLQKIPCEIFNSSNFVANQGNGRDCGVYCCQYMKLLANGVEPQPKFLNPTMIPQIRLKMIVEFLLNTVL